MTLQPFKKQPRHLLVDIDTQKDFLLARGNACIRNHAEVLANIRRVMAWARHKNVPVISTAEVYRNNGEEDAVGYCIDGTDGQRKIPYTLLNNRTSFPADNKNALPLDLLQAHRQVILHKRCIDPFDEPRIDRLLSELQAGDFILIGAGTEDAVKATALGLLQRGKNVMVVVDALGSHNSRDAKLALHAMEAKGAKLIETKKIAGVSHLRCIGTCGCESCRRRAEERKSSQVLLAEDIRG